MTVWATVKLNPVTAALPAFLVLLGEGRHPAIIYTQGWDAPALVQCGDEQFRNTAKLRFQSREHTHRVPVPDNVQKIPYRQPTQTKPQQPQEISTESAKPGGGGPPGGTGNNWREGNESREVCPAPHGLMHSGLLPLRAAIKRALTRGRRGPPFSPVFGRFLHWALVCIQPRPDRGWSQDDRPRQVLHSDF